MEEKKRNFFNDIWTSIRDFEKYEEFAADKISKAIKYILLLTLLFTLIIGGVYTYKFHLNLSEVRLFIDEKIDDIKYDNNKLQIIGKEPIILENEKGIIQTIAIDTSEEANTEELTKKIKAYDNGILILSDRIIISSRTLNQERNIYLSELPLGRINNKQELMNMFSERNSTYIYLIFFETIFVYLFIVYSTSNLVDAIVLGVLGYIFARIVRLRLRFKATFNIGIYALTLPIVLNLIYITVQTFTGFRINQFQWMYTSISYIYVAVAILMIKTEIINQKIELMRLQKIQEEAKQEAVEEEKEEDDKKEKDSEKDDRDEKKEENDKLGGEEPEGSNA